MLVLVFSAVFIIVLVLIQRGKGADAGAGFGAGASGTVFGARGATTALSRATAILAAVFMVTCLLLSYIVTRNTRAPESVLDRIETTGTPVPTVPAAPPAPEAAVPVVPPAAPENAPAQ
jgi:preprotein translocase subunit SecG